MLQTSYFSLDQASLVHHGCSFELQRVLLSLLSPWQGSMSPTFSQSIPKDLRFLVWFVFLTPLVPSSGLMNVFGGTDEGLAE